MAKQPQAAADCPVSANDLEMNSRLLALFDVDQVRFWGLVPIKFDRHMSFDGGV